MFLLEAVAPAQSGTGSLLMSVAMFIPLIAVMYFFMIRPQKKAEKKATEMRNALEIGDTVTTIGGIIGIVASVKEDTIILETGGDRTKIRFKRSAIADVEKLKID